MDICNFINQINVIINLQGIPIGWSHWIC